MSTEIRRYKTGYLLPSVNFGDSAKRGIPLAKAFELRPIALPSAQVFLYPY